MAEKENKQYGIPYPEMHAFAKKVDTAAASLLKDAPQPTYMIEKIDYPEEGGIYIYHQDLLFPTKGFPFPEACEANNILKKYFVGQIRLLSRNWIFAVSLLRKKNLHHWLEEFCLVSHITMDRYFLEDIRYSKPCREMRKFIEVFLTELGFADVAPDFARNFVTMLEYDNAYLLRLQDLANETSPELLLNNSGREIQRLLGLLRERDNKDHRAPLRAKFEAIAFLISLVIWVPKIKRAVRKAMAVIDFSKIQMDETDRYYVLRWSGYNYFGEEDEVRMERFRKMHNYVPPRQYILKVVEQ